MTRFADHFRPGRFRAAVTLVELVLSIAIVSIILLGVQSAMVIAARALPDRVDGDAATSKAAQAMDQLSADLSLATSITSATVNSIEFTVPDRNSDGTPETIKYSWAGATGSALIRTINNGTAAKIAASVTEFQLLYDKRSQQRTATYTESAEMVLSSYDGLGILNLGDAAITSTQWFGQYFVPSLPANASTWRVTRASFRVRSHGSAVGSTRVQIRAAKGNAPGVVVDEVTLSESGLSSSYAWQEVAFSKASGLTPGAGAYLAFQWGSDAHACDIQYQLLGALALNANLVKTTNGGSSWTAGLTQDMGYYIYGTYSTADAAAYDYFLTDVRCRLRASSNTDRRIRTTIRLLNEPQVTGP